MSNFTGPIKPVGTLKSQPGSVTTVIITPVSPAEIDTPFRFGTEGLVAFTTDPVRRAQEHIIAVAFTRPGERPMRPTYGAGIQSLVFENNDLALFQAALTKLKDAYVSADGDFSVTDVTLKPSNQEAGTWLFAVTYMLNQDPNVHQAVFDTTGNFVGTT